MSRLFRRSFVPRGRRLRRLARHEGAAGADRSILEVSEPERQARIVEGMVTCGERLLTARARMLDVPELQIAVADHVPSSTAGRGSWTAASVATAPGFTVTRREALFVGPFVDDFRHPMDDVSPDGQTFAMLRPGPTEGQVVVVLDWRSELRERLAARR